MILDTPISLFKSVTSTEPVTTRLGAFLDSKKWRPAVEQVRAVAEKAVRDTLKKQLPAATVSGVFTKRSAAELKQYNGLVCLDFDAKENPGRTPEEMRDVLAHFDECLYAGLSVSGQGVFAIISTNNTNPDKHAQVVDILGKVLEQYDLYYDRACKDVCRLRIISFDPDAHWNPEPTCFDAAGLMAAIEAKKEDPARRPRPILMPRQSNGDGGTTDKKVERLIEVIEQQRIDMTADYQIWMRLGMALATEFGSSGEDYFHRISLFHPKYDYQETKRKYADFVRNARRVRIGTFFKICNDNGVRL